MEGGNEEILVKSEGLRWLILGLQTGHIQLSLAIALCKITVEPKSL